MDQPREVYRFSMALRALLWLCVLAIAAWTMGIIGLLPIAQNEPLWTVWSSLTLLLAAAFAAWYSHKRVEIDADGIQTVLPGMAPSRLLWTQVRRIREKADSLDLQGDPGPTVRIEFLFANIERLREIIIHRCPQATPGRILGNSACGSLPVSFRVPLGSFIFFFVFGALALAGGAFFCWQQQNLRLGLACIGLGCLLLIYKFFAWHSVTLAHDMITLQALLRRRNIPLDKIAGAEIQMVRSHGGHAVRVLEIAILRLTNGKTVRLPRFKEGAIHVREAINAVLSEHCGAAKPRISTTDA